jgi:hypothetical protein
MNPPEPKFRYVKQHVDVPEDFETVEQMIRRELWTAYREALYIEDSFILHHMIFGTWCGPALCMVDPTKLGYGGWIRHESNSDNS